MTPDRAAAIIQETVRRSRPSPIRESAFPKQRAFLDDPAKFKALLCTRRAGKSYSVGLMLCESAMTFPGTAHVYLGLTRDTVRRIMVDPVLKVINRTFSLGAKFIEKPLEMRFLNGSVIYLLGVDATDEERDKVLGQKFKKVAIDECGSMRYDLSKLVKKYIRPTLVDLDGKLLLAGTPENVKNFFYEVTEGLDPDEDWAIHKWSAYDNPHVADNWEKEIAKLVAKNPLIVETPWFKQHYLGQWTVDTSALVYKYDRKRNWIPEAPFALDDDGVHFIMAVDLGFRDATAILIIAYREHDPNLYILEAHKWPELIVAEVAARVRGFMDRYVFERMVADFASKQVVEELRQRYKLPFEAAEKSAKADAIALMNSDFLTGRIKVVGDACEALTDEYANLVWDEKAPKPTENSACDNHLTDCSLYGWREALNYAAVPAKEKPSRGSEEEQEVWEEEEERRERGKGRAPYWERE